jgi:hypothetical protein
MATYKVISDLVVGKNAGDSITSEELEGSSIEVLLEAGHIEVAKTTKTTKEAEAE